eukprot:CAMPEP_0181103446 /NCGR_PEP_ID=MMETSP1071-20121207/14870_1 /TAXON_ID=35127 /ORGANISM="Thalassiosira sp., Strain NH16" /LENGTH=593 /DNA_ID=CAMNT_0023186521 /DNA_START=111 /DNA_END=1892 /DNA_ORIENTATION=+
MLGGTLFIVLAFMIYEGVVLTSGCISGVGQLPVVHDVGIGGTSGKSCDDILDNLDKRFNEMRAARRNETAKMNLGNVPPQLWWDMFEPEATCFTDERFGSNVRKGRYGAFGDGPKFLCGIDSIAKKTARFTDEGAGERCLVYSIGSNNDISFERAVYDHISGCEIHTFDPTLNTAFVGDKYATFHDWGVGEDGQSMSFGEKTWTAKGLETIMQELGHTDRTIDIIKIDCEGCEYTTLPPFFDAIASGKVRIGQLQIEMHAPAANLGSTQDADLPMVHDFFAAADRAKLRIFHKERNHWGCYGYNCVEYAFASEEFLREANEALLCPSGYLPLPSVDMKLESGSQDQARSTTTSFEAVTPVEATNLFIEEGRPLFDEDLIPKNTVVDMNIGTNYDPLITMEGRHRILVDPLFYVCDSNAKLTTDVTAFCFAVSNQTTHFSTFLEYNDAGVSSSLSKVSSGTSHAGFQVKSKKTVLVLEANVLFSAIDNRNTTIHRLKMDMQGWELSSLRNFFGLLKRPRFVAHIMAECFCERNGKQIYDVDNSCEKIDQLLKEADYETKGGCESGEWSDVIGYKKGMGLEFFNGSWAWEGRRPD